MGTRGSPDIYTLSPPTCGPQASGYIIKQTNSAYGITIKYVPIATGVQKKRNIYMSPVAFSLKKLKRKLWKNYTWSKTDHDYKAFKEAINKLRHLTRNLRIHHEQHIITNIGRNSNSFWYYINSHMKTRSDIDSIQRPDGSTATFDEEKAELLNS